MHKYKKDNRLMHICCTFFSDKKDIYNIITTFVLVKLCIVEWLRVSSRP